MASRPPAFIRGSTSVRFDFTQLRSGRDGGSGCNRGGARSSAEDSGGWSGRGHLQALADRAALGYLARNPYRFTRASGCSNRLALGWPTGSDSCQDFLRRHLTEEGPDQVAEDGTRLRPLEQRAHDPFGQGR